MKTPAHLSCGVAALALLLAACGGGGGNDNNDKAVSASPVAPVNPLAPVNPVAPAPVAPANTESASTPPVTTNYPVIAPPSSTTPASPVVTTPDARPTESIDARPNSSIAAQPGDAASNPPEQTANVALTTSPVSPIAEAPLPQPAAVTPQPVPLISAQGVRGDVLLTMMDQQPCSHYLNETTSHDGLTVPEETIPTLSIYSRLTPTNYPAAPVMPAPGYPPPGYRDVTCSSGYYPYQPAAADDTYEYESSTRLSYNRSCRSESCPRGFHYLSLSIPFIVGKDSVRLGRLMKTDMEEGNIDPSGYDPTKVWHAKAHLAANTDFSFKLGDMVPFGIKHVWESGSEHIQLMVLDAAPAKDTAKLCWNVVSSYVKRLQCIVWKIPAGWKRGQLLEDIDSYIIDDRSSYPNETGLAYFRVDAPWKPKQQ